MSRGRGRPAQHIAIPVFTWVMVAPAGDGPQRAYRHSWVAIRDRASVALLAVHPDDGHVRRIVADLSARLEHAPTYAECATRPIAISIRPSLLAGANASDLCTSVRSASSSSGIHRYTP